MPMIGVFHRVYYRRQLKMRVSTSQGSLAFNHGNEV
jgi:hypothetical protein